MIDLLVEEAVRTEIVCTGYNGTHRETEREQVVDAASHTLIVASPARRTSGVVNIHRAHHHYVPSRLIILEQLYLEGITLLDELVLIPLREEIELYIKAVEHPVVALNRGSTQHVAETIQVGTDSNLKGYVVWYMGQR